LAKREGVKVEGKVKAKKKPVLGLNGKTKQTK
jgi:hypothetical protein